MMRASEAEAGNKFAELVQILARLRAPGGCPWDRVQTLETIKPYLLEETYEVLDAIDSKDWPGLADELGDLLLQPVFLAAIAAAEGLFNIADCLDAINGKLVRRHPHVFSNAVAETPADVTRRWEEIKSQEKRDKGAVPITLLEAVPRNLPALIEAQKVTAKASSVGFDWPDVRGVLEKLQEEAQELVDAEAQGEQRNIEHELGDLLFTVVNLARFLRVDPEQALRGSTGRFRKRFGTVERLLEDRGETFTGSTIEYLEGLWQAAKTEERAVEADRHEYNRGEHAASIE